MSFKQRLKRNLQGVMRIACLGLFVIPISGCEILYSTILITSCGTLPDLKISPEKLPEAIIGQPYYVEFSASMNQTSIGSFHLSSGRLPAGLEFVYVDDNSGGSRAIIEGIPTEIGDFPITIETRSYGTQCSGQSGEQQYVLTMNAT
ncbi:MAG: hypothetical protein GY787_16035 [Alteromonadales bacterium]|nr:hypothetical protein [Alteromonadales bacterium]